MNFHAITDKQDSYIQLVKTLVSWLVLCLKKRGTPRRNSPNVGIAPLHPNNNNNLVTREAAKINYSAR